jgi:DNA integrity scanning protein DisA with diadenylate cyclase activity
MEGIITENVSMVGGSSVKSNREATRHRTAARFNLLARLLSCLAKCVRENFVYELKTILAAFSWPL